MDRLLWPVEYSGNLASTVFGNAAARHFLAVSPHAASPSDLGAVACVKRLAAFAHRSATSNTLGSYFPIGYRMV